MSWSIAQAKQQFSEVVRLAAEEPQAIYNRATPVAVIVGTQDYEAFKQWQATHGGNPLLESLNRLREALAEAGGEDVGLALRRRENRPNAFGQTLNEEYGAAPPAVAPPATKKGRARGTR